MLDVNNKTVAIICNGASLKQNNYAELIDSHDIVVRMNHGGVYSNMFSNVVGKKTNIFATNCFNGDGYCEVLDYIKKLPKDVEILAVRPYHGVLREDFHITPPFKELFKNIHNKIHIITNDFYINNMVNGYYNFSTGIIIMLFFLKLPCSKVSVFGYDHGSGGYYYNNNTENIFNHNKQIENSVFERVIKLDKRFTFL